MAVAPEAVKNYGLTALPASADAVLPKNPGSPAPYPVSSTPIPPSPLAERVQKYARENLPRQVFHHSMRVYHFGLAIARQHFPAWHVDKGSKLEETFFLCAMLHDIGTTEENRKKTAMSFELHGGIIALDLLQHDHGAVAPKEQAESVAESIVRHQDIEERGHMSTLTQLIQLATIFDNAGKFADYVHKDTIEDVNAKWPREKWLGCFAETVKKEMSEKPWSTTTRLGVEDFPKMIMANDLMRPYE